MSGDRPSVYVPFTRRFTNERARELQETTRLYASLRAHQDALPEPIGTFAGRFFDALHRFPDSVSDASFAVFWALLAWEDQIWALPPPETERMTMQEFVEYRNLLYAKEHFFANQTYLLARLEEGVLRVLGGLADEIPESASASPFSIPLIFTLPRPRETVDALFATLSEYHAEGLFRSMSEQLYRNICAASGREPYDEQSRKPLVTAASSLLPLGEVPEVYLRHTPFRELFEAPMPLRLTYEDRFSHMHVIGGSGSGKTTLIETLVRHDLASDDPPSIVVVDPHSDLVRKLVRSDLGIEDRLVLIDPRDTAYPLALNPFALNKERLATYDEASQRKARS